MKRQNATENGLRALRLVADFLLIRLEFSADSSVNWVQNRVHKKCAPLAEESTVPGIHPNFIQDGPALRNTFADDRLLRAYVAWKIPGDLRSRIDADLQKFGGRCAGELQTLAAQAEATPPRHIPYSPWGKRIDEIAVSPAWEALHAVAAEEGLIAIGYERREGELSRFYQFAKLYLFHPSSAFYSCPLAMTDGAARVIELHGSDALKAGAFKHLTSRDAKKFWTSGQWMTERTGGSDVSGTSTVARREGKGFALFGDKWFTSATTSQMAMALAKVEGAGDAREGLSLFYVELRDEKNQLRKIRINRLKEKLGTKALPTAELTLDGTPAEMVGGVSEGVKKVASLLNITRLYNSVTALGAMARALTLAKDYARKRSVFGKMLDQQPLHLTTLTELQTEFEGCFALGFHLIHLLGKDETGSATPRETSVLRLLTPVMKLWSAKRSIATVSEVIESFGGAGYIEDSGLPQLLRDAQVFSIWEGTTNVLSLDALRAIAKDQALNPFFEDVEELLGNVDAAFSDQVAIVRSGLATLRAQTPSEVVARAYAFGLARVYAAALMLEFASECSRRPELAKLHPGAGAAVRNFCLRPLTTFSESGVLSVEEMRKILY